MHKVKCNICGEIFDRDKIPALLISPRKYAHQSCCPDGDLSKVTLIKRGQGNSERTALTDYVQEKFNPEQGAYIQLEKMKKQYNYTYTGMLKTLKWWYEVQKNPVKGDNPIGIIPYAYNKAADYFYAIWLANDTNAQQNIPTMIERVREFEIEAPQYIRKIKLFDFGDLEEEE